MGAADIRHPRGAVGSVPSSPCGAARAAALAALPDADFADECILGGGDDYELAFTAPSAKRGEVESAGRAAGVQVTRIGWIVAGTPEVRVLAGGKPVAASSNDAHRGFDHFR
jgi:thiamine-monophosphate kinase